MTTVLKVLLFLLKCIGILLLVLLGLLLLVVILVLLAPVRYRGQIDKKEAPEEVLRADGLISWLNPFLRVRIQYTEKKLKYRVRVLGFCLLNSEKPKKEKVKKEKKKKVKKNRKQKGNAQSTEADVGIVSEQNPGDVHTEGQGAQTVPEGTSPKPHPEGAEVEEQTGTESGDGVPKASSEQKKEKTSMFAKIKQVIEKIKAIPEKIKQKVTQIVNTIKLLWYKKEKVAAFLQDELHKTAIGKAWNTVKQVLRHVLPGKIKGHVEFGTGNPETTGKALGVLGVLYAAYGKGVTVVPDFYEKRVVAELEFKGRIRLGTLLLKGLRLICDKQVKRFIQNFKKLLKILKQKAE